MLGYVVPLKSELKLREFEIYNSYYCAVCKSVARRYGQLPRLLLSYDFIFLAMILSAPSEETDKISAFRCITHPGKRRNVAAQTPEIDYAADVMLLLGYYNLKDDRDDEQKVVGYVGERFLRRAYRKIRREMPEKAEIIGLRIEELRALERAETRELDRAEEPFSLLMEEVLDWKGIESMPQRTGSTVSAADWTISLRKAYRRIGYHLGKWIYLIDAIDDLEKDIKSGSYNPLKYEQQDAERLNLLLTLYLAEIAKVYEVLPIRKNSEILENIIYLGLNKKTEDIVTALQLM
jgi:hypothetical protein